MFIGDNLPAAALALFAACESLGAATHLAVVSPHKHAPREGLDDDGSRTDPAVGQAGPPHAVLLLEHHGRPDPAQMLGQPGEGQSGGPCGQRPLSWSGTKPLPLGPAWTPPTVITVTNCSNALGT